MSRYAMCPQCGHRLKKIGDGEYVCEYCGDSDYFDFDDDDERLSVDEAAEIWASNGKDEDYTFGYTEEELEEALD